MSLLCLLCLFLAHMVFAVPVQVNAPGKGLMSLGVYTSDGMLVRTLTAAKPVEAGAQTLDWDATSELGLPVAPGKYQVRGVWFPEGPKVSFRMKVGLSGNPPYVTPDGLGSWGGNLGAPTAVCSNGTQVVAAFGCVEDHIKTGVQLMDADGKVLRRYQTFFPWDIRLACAMDAQNMYLAVANIGAKRLVVAKYSVDNPKGKILADIPTAEHPTPEGRWKGRWTVEVQGLALANGRVYVPVLLDNRVTVVDAETGALRKSVEVASPRGIAAFRDTVYVLSGTQLLSLDADGAPAGTVPVTGLEDPSGLAIDSDGNFYIADGGAAQQVKVFSPQGAVLRTIGRTGGRPRNGLFKADGMLDPRGICLGPHNRLWVTEANEDFQRISVWDAKSGKLQQDFFNTRISSGQGQLNPDRTEMIFTNDVFADVPGMTGYAVDFTRNIWAPAWYLRLPQSMMSQDEVFLGNTHIYGQLNTTFNGHHPYLSFAGGMMKAANGRTYAYGGEFSIWLFDEKTKQVKLASFVYTHRAHKLPDGRFEGDYDQGPNNWLSWSDLNGDGKMAREECTFTENQPLMAQTSRLFSWELQPDLSILMLCPINKPGKLGWASRRLPARQVLPSGVPVYDWADLQPVMDLPVPSFVGGDGWKGGESAYLTNLSLHDNAYYVYAEPTTRARLRLSGIDGDGWWASRNWRQTALRFDANTGKSAWLKLGRRAPAVPQPGEMTYPREICATIDGAVFLADTLAQMWVWTEDGLYLGKLYHDSWQGIHDADSLFIELVGAYVYKINGKIYACTGDHGVSVHEVTLPKLTNITAGEVIVTPEIAAAAKPWDPDGPVPGKRPAYTAQSIYDFQEKKAVRTITIDGRLDDAEWSKVKAMEITQDNEKVAEVRAVFDQVNLYLAYTVTDPHGLRNAGTELPLCPFVSGSYVDFCLGRDWTTPQREENKAGDLRVIFARITGREVSDYQLAYWPVKANGKNPQTITSPAAQRSFAEIAPLPGVRFAYTIIAKGYTLEVVVPFAALELNPQRTPTVGFDASVAFTNAEAAVRLRAAHWAGESEALVVDRPGSAALKPATWGTLLFDRSPLPAP